MSLFDIFKKKEKAHDAIDGEINANNAMEVLNTIVDRNQHYSTKDKLYGFTLDSYKQGRGANPYMGETVASMMDTISTPRVGGGMDTNLINTLIRQIMTPEGNRYYGGRGSTFSMTPNVATRDAMLDATTTFLQNPADSIPTSVVNALIQQGIMK